MGFPHFNNTFCEGGDLNGYHPFRFWCYNILPLIYDDSLSQYDIICKLYDQMNKVVQDTVTLTNLVDCLTQFIRDMQTHLNNLIDNYNTTTDTINANIATINTNLATKVSKAGDTMTGDLNMGTATDSPHAVLSDGGLNVSNGAGTESTAITQGSIIQNDASIGKTTIVGAHITLTPNTNQIGSVSGLTTPVNAHDATNKEYVDNKIAGLGTVLEYKGSVATINDLPPTGNKIGDVRYVESEKSAYAWVVDAANPNGHWEEFGPPINFEPYLKHDGSVAMTGNLDMGGHNINYVGRKISMAQGQTIIDAVSPNATIKINPMTGQETDLVIEPQKVAVNFCMGANPMTTEEFTVDKTKIDMHDKAITNVNTPTADKDAANKKYVDDAVAGAGGGTGDFKADGSVPMTGELEMNGNSIDFTPIDGISNHLAVLSYSADSKNISLSHNLVPSGGSSITLHSDKITNVVNSRPVMTLGSDNNITLNNGKIINMKTPTEDTDAANKKYVDDKVAAVPTPDLTPYMKTDGSTPMTGNLNVGNNKIANVAAPTVATDATNKNYVDTLSVPSGGTSGQILTKLSNLSYNIGWNSLPQATDTLIGGIKAAPVTADDTQDVHITTDGHLKTKAGGGLSPITVTRDEAYISTPGNNNTTKVLADPTAPTDKPIQAGQIAVYSTTNQTYNTEDVGATLLVADPHSAMEAVNKRTLDGYLPRANIDDNYYRVTTCKGLNPGTPETNDYVIVKKDLATSDMNYYKNCILVTNSRAELVCWTFKAKDSITAPTLNIDFLSIPTNQWGHGISLGGIFGVNNGNLNTGMFPYLRLAPYLDQGTISNQFVIRLGADRSTNQIQTFLIARVTPDSTPETIILDAKAITIKVKEPVNNDDAVTKNYVDTNFIKVEGTPQEGSTIAYMNGKWTVVDHTTWTPFS